MRRFTDAVLYWLRSRVRSATLLPLGNYEIRVNLLILAVMVLAILGSCGALLSVWRIKAKIGGLVEENVPSVYMAKQLQVTLLEQRGLASSYMLRGGSRESLDRLTDKKGRFETELERARRSTYTDDEARILARLETAYGRYDSCRTAAIRLFNAGHTSQAVELLGGEVVLLAEQAHDECESLVASNERQIQIAARHSREEASVATLLVIGMSLLIGAASIMLVVYLSRRLIRPIHQMARDAARFAGAPLQERTGPGPQDLITISRHLSSMMDQVIAGRGKLEENQKRLAHSERLATVGKLTATIAHEVRNPLACMKLWLHAIQRLVREDPEIFSHCMALSAEIDRMSCLVDSLLDFTRPRKAVLAEREIDKILEESLQLVRLQLRQKHIDVVRKTDTPNSRAVADADMVKQVFLNLLCNSIEATDGGGKIMVETSVEQENGGGQSVVVRIQDEGTGVPPKVQENLFRPFISTKEKGVGLGLHIAHEIMLFHGGDLVLESSTEEGSRFAVRIPAAAEDGA